MQIELATHNDIPQLSTLLQELFSQEAEFQPDMQLQFQGLDSIIRKPEIGCILVAREDQAVLGMVNLLFTVSTALGAPVAILEDMIVKQGYRNAGIGQQLVTAAIDYAKQHGCKRITLLTDKDNFAAHQFYAKQGFTVSGMIPLRLKLG